MIRRVFKESFLYTIANHAPLFINILILPIITPYLTSKDYGIYGLALAYTGLLSSLANLGFIPMFQNSFFKENETYKENWGSYFGILIIWKFLYGIIVLILLAFVFYEKVETNYLLVILFLVGIPIIFFDLSKTIGLRLCQYTNNHKKVYTITFVTSIISIISTFIGVYYLRLGYIAWFVSGFLASLLQFLYFFHFLYFTYSIKPKFKFPEKFVRGCLKVSLPLIPIDLSSYLLDTSDRIILDNLNISLLDIGRYNLAYSFSNYFKSFNNSMNSVLSPIYFKLLSKKDADISEQVKIITYIWFFFILLLGFILCIWLKEIFQFLYRNEDLSQGYYLAIFIIMGFTYQPFYVATVDRAIYYGKSKSILKISMIAGVINIILNFILIPYWGVFASVVSTFIGYIYLGFAGFFDKEIRVHIVESYNLPLVIITIFSTGLIVYFLRDISISYKIAISVMAIISGWLLWKYTGKEKYLLLKGLK
jgi:O-antigen/teichoic acid export membrane protein